MTTTIPNTSTSGTVGSPSPASIATESVDNTVTATNSDIIQQMSLVNIAAELRNIQNVLATSLGLANDPASGRLRILLDSITSGVVFPGLNVNQYAGFPNNNVVFDEMTTAWATGTRAHIT